MAKKKSKKKVFIFLGILIVLIVAIFLLATKNTNTEIKVTVEKVGRRTITQTVTAIGKIQPETEIKISPETSGEIIYLGVKEGDTVKTGQLLVKIKPDIIETQLEQQRASLEATKMDIAIRKAELTRVKSSLKRVKELYEKEFSSQDELDKVQASYQQANSSYKASLSRYQQAFASLKQVQRNAERTTIFAPQDGIVTKLTVEKGEKVVGTEMMAGTDMMIVSDLNIMNAVVEVDENDIVLVKVGDTARIEIDAFPDRIFRGKVIEIGHSAITNQLGTQDQVTNFQVKIRMIDLEPKLRPGMSCSVDIETQTRKDIIAVPLQAVTIRTKGLDTKPDINEDGINKDEEKTEKVKRPPSVVFVQDGKKAKKIEVSTGISDNGFIEITKGLKAGDKIITGNFIAVSKKLEDGTLIKVDTRKSKFNKKNKHKD